MPASSARQLANLISQAVEEIESDTASQLPGSATTDVNQPVVAPEDSLELTPRRRMAIRTLEAATQQLLSTLMPTGWRIGIFQAGHLQAVAIEVVVRGRIADVIHSIDPDSTKGGVHIDLLAEKAGTDPRKLRHIMRNLALYNIFCEFTPNHWVNTRGSVPLRTDSPNTLINTMGVGQLTAKAALMELPNVLFNNEEGGTAFSDDIHHSAFHKFYKPEGDVFEFFSKSEGGWRAKMFGNAMLEVAQLDPTPYKAFEWQKKLGQTGTLIDLGGGMGGAAYAISAFLPEWNIVVQDRGEIVKLAKENHEKNSSAARVEFEEADFFKEQPPHRVGEVDAYFVRQILHDWPFKHCVEILTHLRRAAKPTTHLLVYGINLEPPIRDPKSPILSNGGAASARAHMLNLTMLTYFNAEERSKEEHSDIFKASGWILKNATSMSDGDECMFEGVPDPAWKTAL